MPAPRGKRSGVGVADTSVELIDIAEFDLSPPPLKTGLVLRPRLLDRLSGNATDIVVITAPSGYGKTTLLVQWAGLDPASMAWLSLRPQDNDARNLMVHLASSIARITDRSVEEAAMLRFLEPDGIALRGATLLAEWASRMPEPAVIIIDNAHLLRGVEVNAMLAELVRQLEGHHKLVFASRSSLKLPTAELRSHGRLTELTERDLAMTPNELAQLMADADAEGAFAIEDLLEVTQGWPAAAFLLSVAIRSGHYEGNSSIVGGDDRLLREFVRTEVIPGLSKARREFLTTVSPLETISAPLCDRITESTRSRAMIEEIESSTHLIHPIDAGGDWYAVNRVVRDALRSELGRSDPELLATVHTRAAAWFEEADLAEDGIRHAQAVGDMDAVARLMGRSVKQRYATGGAKDILAWMQWLQSATSIDKYPLVAAVGALALAQEGEALDAEKWMDAAVRTPPDEGTAPIVWMVRALACRSGVPGMIHDTEMALAALTPGSEWVPAMLLTAGLARIWSGELADAEPLLIEAAETGQRSGSYPAASLALAERSIGALDRGDWNLAASLADAAMGLIGDHRLDGYLTSGLAFVAAARCARRDNDIARTKSLLASAEAIRPRMSSAIPGVAVQTLLEMARAYLELSDVVGARALIRQASDLIAQRPGLGVLPDQAEMLQETMRNLGPGTTSPSALTKAELRLLPLLATNLSFPQIGEQLFVSRHTVKTQAMSIYRKLGTSSRSDAVARAFEVGLLTR